MLISHRHKFIFIHTYKVAGQSVTRALKEYADEPPSSLLLSKVLAKFRVSWRPSSYKYRTFLDHVTASDLKAELPPKLYADFFKFAFVRNPWDWQVSLYHYALSRPNHHQYELIKSMSGFREYLFWRVEKDKHLQEEFVTDSNGDVIVDYIGRLETLDHDFRNITKRIGVQAELPHINKSKHEDYREYYDEEMAELIATHFARDIDRFGYTFDGLVSNAPISVANAV